MRCEPAVLIHREAKAFCLRELDEAFCDIKVNREGLLTKHVLTRM